MGVVENGTIVNDGEGHLPKEAKKVLYSLAAVWDDVVDTNALNVVPLQGAMTNAVFAVDWSTARGKLPRKVLVRIYGEGVEVFFDREDEIRTFECMSKHGQGPRLLGRFKNGRVEEFINARTLSASDLRDSEISALVATKLREFHYLDMPGPKDVILWDRLRRWCVETKRMCSADEAKEFRLDDIEMEIPLLEKGLSRENQSIGFCHNDLQYGNIMIDNDGITIIDYEYAGFNPVPFDLANHFCEMAADYHSETPHILDYDKYPDLEERQRFARAYLSSSENGNEPSDTEVQQLVEDAEKYTLASHLLWGLWGVLSEKVNEIDYNYIEYARQRFRQYWATRSRLLGVPEDVKDDGVDGCAVVT